jgi:hypothetical protein
LRGGKPEKKPEPISFPDYQPEPEPRQLLNALIGEPPAELPAFVREKPHGRDDFEDRLPF